ncbi:hypothetical protein [Herbaspirillum sp. NPDC101397]|uniref:hypothetical protein n=1 Tax=Herbaspirillum sp. NPDC101397 TaxID=3364006 RepID=UPI00383BA560
MKIFLGKVFASLLATKGAEIKTRSQLLEIAFDALAKSERPDLKRSGVSSAVDALLQDFLRDRKIVRIRRGVYGFGTNYSRVAESVQQYVVPSPQSIGRTSTQDVYALAELQTNVLELRRENSLFQEKNDALTKELQQLANMQKLPSSVLEWVEHDSLLCISQEEFAALLTYQGASL